MSKDNISLNDILEEFSPDGQKKVEKNNTNTDNQPKEIPVEPPKTLEQLEMERLQAISKGELSDSAINYATFTNKPNKIIQNPTESSNSNQYYTKGVIKINSRPDRKETNQDSYNKSPNNDDIDNENSNEHKKIDSRNSKAKLESSNLKKDYARSHNDISNEDFAIMSEKISKAKAKKKHQIEELNSNHSTSTTSTEDTPKDTTVDTQKKAKKKDKKSLWNRIVDYYTIPVEEDFPTDDTDLNSNVDVTSTTSATSDIQDTTNDIQKDKKSNRKLFNTKKKEKVSKAKKVDTPIADTPKVESTPIVDNSSSVDTKKKEKKSKAKKVDTPIADTPKVESTPIVDNSSSVDTKKKEKVSKAKKVDTPIADTPKVESTPIVDTSSSVDTNKKEKKSKAKKIDTPIADTPKVESTPIVDNSSSVDTKKKETFKEFLIDLFTDKEKAPPRKHETFKERMTEFFNVQEDETIETTQSLDLPTENTSNPIDSEVPNNIDNLLNNLVDNTITEKPPVTESIIKDTPIAEKPPVTENIINDTPIAEKPPVTESIIKDTPIAEKPPVTENIIKDTPIAEETPVTENIIKDTPIAEETPVTENIIKDTPIAEETPVTENIIKDTPIAEETPVAESIIKDTPTEKKPNVFKRIKNFFLMEEIMEMQNSNDDDTEDTPTDTNLDDILENSTMDTPPIEEIPKEENTSQPIEEPKEVIKPVEETISKVDIEEKSKVEDTSKDIESKSSEVNTSVPDDDYIIPFSEETSNDAIDIPIEEPIKYKHFWQDPDFNPIDRIKSYVEEASEKHRNRKRSGEIHIEIKSTPDTSILFSNVEKGVLEEQKIIKSREEFKKQVLNGEYDNYEETLNKSNLEQDEHTFEDTSVNDFNSYEDKSKVKQYIAEMKTNLLVRIIITLVLCILSLYITLANDLNLPIFDTLKTTTSASGYLMVQSAIGLVAILTSVKAVFSGIVKLFTRKADSDSFASIGIVSAFIGSLVTFFMGSSLVEEQLLNVYMPIALIGLLANLSGKMLIIKREEHNFKFISRDKDKFGTFCMQDDYNAEKITKGLVEDYPVTVYKKKSKFASDFIKYTYSYDMADRFSKFAVPTISVIALIVSIIASIVYNKSFDMVIPVGIISIFSMFISFCSCFSIPLYINNMLYRVSEKYAKRDGALLGYQAVEDFYDTNSIILNASDIFPKGSVNISALKLFSNAKVDETLIYAISLAKNMNSILAPTLLDMLDGNWDMLCDVENCSYEDGLGICGWIDNKRVLMGNRELMEAHNIENLPTKSKESELVGSKKDSIYISVSGNLALMLIVDIVPNKKIKQDLHALESSKISIAVNSCDFLVSVNKIEYLFGINPEKVKVIPYELYQETKEYFKEKPKCSSSIVTNGDIGIITKLLVSTKRIHKMSILGNMLHAVACIVGIIIGISFISMGAFRELTPTMILLYNFICSGIILLICKWQKF